MEDLQGVKDCDAFILLTSEGTNKGMYVELGAALLSLLLSAKPKIYAVGKYSDSSVFYYHPAVTKLDSVNGLLDALKSE